MMLDDDVDGSISQFLCFCVYAVAIYAGTYGSCVEIMNWWEFFYYLSFLEIKPFYKTLDEDSEWNELMFNEI